jgi:hypothetical protein
LKEGEYVVRNEAMANPVNAAIVQTINESKGQIDLRGLLGRKMAAGGEVGATSPALDAPQYPRVGEEKQREHDVEIRDLLREIRDLLKEKNHEGAAEKAMSELQHSPIFGRPALEPKKKQERGVTIGSVLRAFMR